ncbi:MAG: glycosyltransferase family 4 protein [Patescibacteria group bacterium]
MKILILSQYFWPEEFLINDFALGLYDRGHEVEVLTGLPNYPSGSFFPGYGWSGPFRNDFRGISVWRSPLIPRGNASGWRLAINYFSFALLACLRGLLACRRSFDFILVFEVSPVTVGIPARAIKALTGAKLFFWVQDLWPESLSATGAVHSKHILNWAGKLTRWIYQGCDRILIQSQGFRESVLKYGAERDQIKYLPNFAEHFYQPVTLSTDASEHALMPPGFRVMFAGNIGKSQDFETILIAAELTRTQSNIQWVILGDGRQRSWVEAEIQRRHLANVHILGRFPKERMPAFFSLADIMLVSLKREPIFALTIPAKIQAYLACGKAVLASLDGEGARIIEEAQAGITVPAESPQALAEAVRGLSELGPEPLQAMGRNARKYYEAHFSRTHLLDEFEIWLHECCD